MTRCSRPRYFIFKETALAEKGKFSSSKRISFPHVSITSGTIILLEPVNYDPPDNQVKFLLKIKATNGGMSDYANVTVFITDANDNVPGKSRISSVHSSIVHSSLLSIGLLR